MKVILSDFQADCSTTEQRESRQKAFQNIDAHFSSENHRFNRKQLALTDSPKEETEFCAIIPRFISTKLTSSSCYQSNTDRYWLVCGFDRRLFGSLYNRSEADYVLTHFKGWGGLTITATFGIVAKRTFQLRHQHLGVAV